MENWLEKFKSRWGEVNQEAISIPRYEMIMAGIRMMSVEMAEATCGYSVFLPLSWRRVT